VTSGRADGEVIARAGKGRCPARIGLVKLGQVVGCWLCEEEAVVGHCPTTASGV
jgi:hypothetical protein